MKKLSFILSLCFVVISQAQNTPNTIKDTLQLFYNIDAFELTEKHQQSIDNFMARLPDSINTIEVYAYCDYLASYKYNQVLSEKRALAIKTYLLAREKPIKLFPKGQVLDKNAEETLGNSKNRRVDLMVSYLNKSKEMITPPTEDETSKLIQKLEVGDNFVVKGLNFIGGQHFLTKVSKPKLEKLLTALEKNPSIHIEIQGHICCQYTGDGMDNYTGERNLSVARAQYIYDYLIEHGIDKERLSYKGFGSSKKLFPEEKDSFQQQKNRRVEIMITKK